MTTLAVGATGAVAGLGVFAAFTATTVNTGNSIGAGTVTLDDNDGGEFGVALYNVSNRGPGEAYARCITVSYTGSLPSDLKLYRETTAPDAANLDEFELVVERGTLPGSTPFGSCTGFTAAETIFPETPALRTLADFPTDWDAGLIASDDGVTTGEQIAYRFSVAPVDDPTPNARDTVVATGAHTFKWEARNQ